MQFVKRSWGWWVSILKRPRFKIKVLWFSAGKKLSVQKHAMRSELWCFLMGRGLFLNKNQWLGVNCGEYRLVPPETPHCYQAFKNTLILEIQFGDKCIEDDIVRLS